MSTRSFSQESFQDEDDVPLDEYVIEEGAELLNAIWNPEKDCDRNFDNFCDEEEIAGVQSFERISKMNITQETEPFHPLDHFLKHTGPWCRLDAK